MKFLAVLAALIVVGTAASDAGSHKPAFGGDFTFRKIGPPSSAGKRITVQIDPESNPFPQEDKPEVEAASPAQPANKAFAWFWEAVSPAIAAGGRGRFTQAVDQIAEAPTGQEVPEPSLAAVQRIASDYGSEILTQGLEKRLSPALIVALISVESGGRPAIESNKGAQGLMQLIPDTAARFGVSDATDPAQNIRGGTAYLAWLMKEFNNDPVLALAGYNAGEGAVRKHNGVPPYAETRAYVPKVLAAWRVARSLCLTPPELASDGCVFRSLSTL